MATGIMPEDLVPSFIACLPRTESRVASCHTKPGGEAEHCNLLYEAKSPGLFSRRVTRRCVLATLGPDPACWRNPSGALRSRGLYHGPLSASRRRGSTCALGCRWRPLAEPVSPRGLDQRPDVEAV